MRELTKDRWDKLDVILKPVGGLMTAVAITLLGFFTTSMLEEQRDQEASLRLYSDLMSQREAADSALRKDMFDSILTSFFRPETESVDSRLLELELLAYNFHDSINLNPLFKDLEREIRRHGITQEEPSGYRERLFKLALDVSSKQKAVLESAGMKREIAFEHGKLETKFFDLEVRGKHSEFRVTLLDTNPEFQEVELRVEIRELEPAGGEHTPEAPPRATPLDVATFWVGYFDFPMVDNSRLSGNQRFAVVLNAFHQSADGKEFAVDLTLIYFPGSHASLKEKPYFDEIITNLMAGNDH